MYKKRLKLYIITGLITLIILLSTGCENSSPQSQQADFDTFINQLFVEKVQSDTISLNYSLAQPEDYGIVHTETTLGEYSISKMKEEIEASKNT